MKKITHEIFSFGIIFYLLSLLKINLLLNLLISLLSIWIGIFPDIIDFKILKTKDLHRNFLSHSPISPIFILYILVILIFSLILFSEINQIIVFSFILILPWIFHLVLDSFNPSGITILFSKKKFKNVNISYDDSKVNFIICLIGIILIIFGVLNI